MVQSNSQASSGTTAAATAAAAAATAAATTATSAEGAAIKAQVIRSFPAFIPDAGQEGCPFAMCHASTIIELTENLVLIAFFAGPHEGDHTEIYLSWFDLESGTTCALKPLKNCCQDTITDPDAAPAAAAATATALPNEAQWNPVLFRVDANHLVLIFKVGNCIATWQSWICHSFDNGQSFTQPQPLWNRAVKQESFDISGGCGRGPVRNQPLLLRSGRVLSPGSDENGIWHAFVDISDPEFSWLKQSAPIYAPLPDKSELDQRNQEAAASTIALSAQSFTGQGVIQPTLYEDEQGVHMLLRSSLGWIYRADSSDEGVTWTQAYPIAVPNNNSGIDIVRIAPFIYLSCNPVSGNFVARTPLVLMVSPDGINFSHLLTVDDFQGELSYPCLIARSGHPDRLLLSYTFDRRHIRIVEIKLDVPPI